MWWYPERGERKFSLQESPPHQGEGLDGLDASGLEGVWGDGQVINVSV